MQGREAGAGVRQVAERLVRVVEHLEPEVELTQVELQVRPCRGVLDGVQVDGDRRVGILALHVIGLQQVEKDRIVGVTVSLAPARGGVLPLSLVKQQATPFDVGRCEVPLLLDQVRERPLGGIRLPCIAQCRRALELETRQGHPAISLQVAAVDLALDLDRRIELPQTDEMIAELEDHVIRLVVDLQDPAAQIDRLLPPLRRHIVLGQGEEGADVVRFHVEGVLVVEDGTLEPTAAALEVPELDQGRNVTAVAVEETLERAGRTLHVAQVRGIAALAVERFVTVLAPLPAARRDRAERASQLREPDEHEDEQGTGQDADRHQHRHRQGDAVTAPQDDRGVTAVEDRDVPEQHREHAAEGDDDLRERHEIPSRAGCGTGVIINSAWQPPQANDGKDAPSTTRGIDRVAPPARGVLARVAG